MSLVHSSASSSTYRSNTRPSTYPPVTQLSLRRQRLSRTRYCREWIKKHRDRRLPRRWASLKSTLSTATTFLNRSSSMYRFAVPTISSLSTSAEYARHEGWDAKTVSPHPVPLPVFHIQSLLFLFGFLFVPCWWVGAFWAPMNPSTRLPDIETGAPPSLLAIHPSLLANGWTTLRVLPSLTPVRHIDDTWSVRFEQECLMYQRWNRIMGIVSIGIIAVIAAMLVWYRQELAS